MPLSDVVCVACSLCATASLLCIFSHLLVGLKVCLTATELATPTHNDSLLICYACVAGLSYSAYV